MAGLIMLALAAVLPPVQQPAVEVELLELNHVYSARAEDDGFIYRRVSLAQWIIWEHYRPLDEVDTGWHVWCWRRRQETEVAMRHPDGWELFYRGPQIVAKRYRETWTEYDPEIIDAQTFPKSYRRAHLDKWQH